MLMAFCFSSRLWLEKKESVETRLGTGVPWKTTLL